MTSQKTMDDTSKVNKWILGYLPKDLIDILKREYTDPTTKGRKAAINDDNVNDFVYYGIRKKLFWKYNGFYQVIKTDSGNKVEPAKYALEKKAYKCYAHMVIFLDMDVHSIKFIFQNRLEAPYWYNLLMFSKERKAGIYKTQYFDDTMYYLLFDCPKKDGLYYADGVLKEVQKYINNLNENDKKQLDKKDFKFKRSQPDDEKDIEFYHNLSGNNKKLLKKLIYQDRAFDLNLDNIIQEEGDLDSIFHFYKPYQFCEYIVKTGKYDEFDSWIESNRKEIDFEKCRHMVMPQFQHLYPTIFKDIKVNKKLLTDDNSSLVEKHFMNLIINKFVQEVKFFLIKGMKFNKFTRRAALETCHPQIIQMLVKLEEDYEIQDAFNELFGDNKVCVQYLMKKGFKPDCEGIRRNFYYNRREPARFELIDLLPKDEKLDDLKKTMAENHIDQVEEFISKYGDRFEQTDIDSWNIRKKHKNYPKLCKILGVEDVESDSPPYESSGSARRRTRSSAASRNQKAPEKVKQMIPFMVCSTCAGKKLCANCHQVSVSYNGVFVCSRHKPNGLNCPICHERRICNSQSRLCIKCNQKYGFKCFMCG